tara:strand:+ start:949 stop:1335 length:387 start_codon:yes stop_codon:yes gene_type:complete
MIATLEKDVSIKKRIGEIVADRGGNRTKLADEIGISPAYLASVINSPDKNVTSKLLKAFAKIEINLNWLLTGEGEMYQNGSLQDRAMKAENRVADLERDLDNAHYYAKEVEKLWKEEIQKAIEKGLVK